MRRQDANLPGAWRAAVIGALLLLAGCAAAPPQPTVTELRRVAADPRIVLMPMDVELSELTAGGLLEPKAEWTQKANALLLEGLRAEKKRMGFSLVEFSTVQATEAEAEILDQLNKVHGVVGRSIMLHRLPALQLPNKAQKFDWTLGPEMRKLKARTGADYALFVFIRDSYASDGRKAAIVVAAVLGVGLQAGTQLGFASLVDLESGDIVWFNQLQRASGDLRAPEPAAESIKVLLTGFPK